MKEFYNEGKNEVSTTQRVENEKTLKLMIETLDLSARVLKEAENIKLYYKGECPEKEKNEKDDEPQQSDGFFNHIINISKNTYYNLQEIHRILNCL